MNSFANEEHDDDNDDDDDDDDDYRRRRYNNQGRGTEMAEQLERAMTTVASSSAVDDDETLAVAASSSSTSTAEPSEPKYDHDADDRESWLERPPSVKLAPVMATTMTTMTSSTSEDDFDAFELARPGSDDDDERNGEIVDEYGTKTVVDAYDDAMPDFIHRDSPPVEENSQVSAVPR